MNQIRKIVKAPLKAERSRDTPKQRFEKNKDTKTKSISKRGLGKNTDPFKPLFAKLLSTKKSNSQPVVDELIKAITDKSSGQQQFASRSCQAALKSGTTEQRKKIFFLLNKNISTLVKSKYSFRLVQKLHTYCGPEAKSHIEQILTTPEVFTSRFGSAVFDYVFRRLGSKGPLLLWQLVFANFRLDVPQLSKDLKSNLDVFIDRPIIFENVKTCLGQLVRKCLDKELIGCSAVQLLVLEYYRLCPVEEQKCLAEEMVDTMHHMTTSRTGVELLCQISAYAGPKKKKAFFKAIKLQIAEWATHPVNSLALARLVHITDDVKLLASSIFKELESELIRIATTSVGARILPAFGGGMKQFPLSERDLILFPCFTSVKDKVLKKAELELLLWSLLIKGLEDDFSQWISDRHAAKVIEAALQFERLPESLGEVTVGCLSKISGAERLALLSNQQSQRTLSKLIGAIAGQSGGGDSLRSIATLIDVPETINTRGVFVVYDLLKWLKELDMEFFESLRSATALKFQGKGTERFGCSLLQSVLSM